MINIDNVLNCYCEKINLIQYFHARYSDKIVDAIWGTGWELDDGSWGGNSTPTTNWPFFNGQGKAVPDNSGDTLRLSHSDNPSLGPGLFAAGRMHFKVWVVCEEGYEAGYAYGMYRYSIGFPQFGQDYYRTGNAVGHGGTIFNLSTGKPK